MKRTLFMLLIATSLMSCGSSNSDIVICPCRVTAVKESDEEVGVYIYTLRGDKNRGYLGTDSSFIMQSREWHLVGDTIR